MSKIEKGRILTSSIVDGIESVCELLYRLGVTHNLSGHYDEIIKKVTDDNADALKLAIVTENNGEFIVNVNQYKHVIMMLCWQLGTRGRALRLSLTSGRTRTLSLSMVHKIMVLFNSFYTEGLGYVKKDTETYEQSVQWLKNIGAGSNHAKFRKQDVADKATWRMIIYYRIDTLRAAQDFNETSIHMDHLSVHLNKGCT